MIRNEGLLPVIYLFTLWQIAANERLMAMTLRIIVPPHPLIAHWLTMLRNASTPAPLYSTALEELGRWLTYEALRDWLPHRNEAVTTPETKTEGKVIDFSVPLLALPLMPEGFSLWQGARMVLPNSHLCLEGVPNVIEKNAGIVIFVDQIATGQKLLLELELLKKQAVEPQRIRVVTALTAAPGLKNLAECFPELNIYTASIDPDVSEEGMIVPGIGNPLIRLNIRTNLRSKI